MSQDISPGALNEVYKRQQKSQVAADQIMDIKPIAPIIEQTEMTSKGESESFCDSDSFG